MQKNIIKAEGVFKQIQELRELARIASVSFLAMGKIFKEIRDSKAYLHYANHIDSWDDFIKDINIGIGKSTSNNFIYVYEKFGQFLSTKKLESSFDHSRLIQALPYVSNEKEAKDWADKALYLTSSDFQKEILKRKTGIEPDGCDHDWQNLPYKQCKICGLRVKI